MAKTTSEHPSEGLLSSQEIEELVTQLVAEEISIQKQNRKLKIAQERALQQAQREREAQLAQGYALSAAAQEANFNEAYEDSDFLGQDTSAFSFPGGRIRRHGFFHKRKAAGSTDISSTSTSGFHSAVDVRELVDYEDVADQYLAGKSFKERLSSISKGVKKVLSERLSVNAAEMMSDLPIIQRADGSVGSIGESWWDDVVSPKPEFVDRHVTEAELRSASIAKRVSPFDDNPFALNQEVVDYNEGSWNQALDALEKNTEEDMALTIGDLMSASKARIEPADLAEDDEFDFLDMDEIDGLEPKTEFLAFRVPGGHPEVSDTASYVNYLVNDELSASENSSVKTQVAKHLRVLEGGSGRIRTAAKPA